MWNAKASIDPGGTVSEPAWIPDATELGAHQQLSHKVAAYVREGIMAGQLPAGQFLRTESLAADLNVSATPVREALMILQSEGSVRWEPRRGFRVVSVSDQDVRDLFQVQAFIAGELAARAAQLLEALAIAGLDTPPTSGGILASRSGASPKGNF